MINVLEMNNFIPLYISFDSKDRYDKGVVYVI